MRRASKIFLGIFSEIGLEEVELLQVSWFGQTRLKRVNQRYNGYLQGLQFGGQCRTQLDRGKRLRKVAIKRIYSGEWCIFKWGFRYQWIDKHWFRW